MVNLKESLAKRVDQFKGLADKLYSNIKDRSGKDPLLWLDVAGSPAPKGTPTHLRRLRYVYDRVDETLDEIERIKNNSFLSNSDKPSDIRKRYAIVLDNFVKKYDKDEGRDTDPARRFDRIARPFSFANVVRRLQARSELAPLRLSHLDVELFTCCFLLHSYHAELIPEERSILRKRLGRELCQYLREQRPYHDLSTIWWGLKELALWPGVNEEKVIEAVRQILDLSFERAHSDDSAQESFWYGLLTHEGRRLASFEPNGDLITELRSVVFCYKNAFTVRQRLDHLRDPRLQPLVQRVREWCDLCATRFMEKYQDEVKKGLRLYDAALALSFCADRWDDRVSAWNGAVEIAQKGVSDGENISPIKKLATTDRDFAEALQNLVSRIETYRETDNQKRPLVVALFGPPGSGKSAIAKAVLDEREEDEEFVELNLAALKGPSELFATLHAELDPRREKCRKKPIVFIDEFDVQLRSGFWYRWLLTLLWDQQYPVNVNGVVTMTDTRVPCVIFLAASRYETFAQFREFALSKEARDQKAPDLLTRIDETVDLPRLNAKDRAHVIKATTKSKTKKKSMATNELLALCYMAELGDNARGIVKLLKAVDCDKEVSVDVLAKTSKEQLCKAAGLDPNELD